MKRFTLEFTIVDSKNTIVLVYKKGKLVRNLILKNEDMKYLVDKLNSI